MTTESKATAKGVKAKAVPQDDWNPARTNDAGQQVDSDGLPLGIKARAMALAEQGKDKDPAGFVSPEMIAAHDPKAAEADREAVAQLRQDQAEKDAKAQAKEAEAAAAANEGAE